MEINKKDILSRTNLFENISKKNITALADICMPKHCRKRDTLFREGESGSALYILVTGNIQLYKTGPDGREIVIRIIKPGEIFAEVILFEQDFYPVTAVALKTSMMYTIYKIDFLSLLKNENFAGDFFGTLMKKMRYLAQKIQYLSSHDVEDRLFLFLEEHHGPVEKIVPSISKKDIAMAIGTTPETLSRLLLRLNNESKLIWEGKTITIPSSIWQARASQ